MTVLTLEFILLIIVYIATKNHGNYLQRLWPLRLDLVVEDHFHNWRRVQCDRCGCCPMPILFVFVYLCIWIFVFEHFHNWHWCPVTVWAMCALPSHCGPATINCKNFHDAPQWSIQPSILALERNGLENWDKARKRQRDQEQWQLRRI